MRTIFILILFLAAFRSSAVTFFISPTPQTVASGDVVTVHVLVANFTDLAGYQFSMSWDPAVLQLQSVTPALPGMSVGGNFNIGNSANGTLTHLFFSQDLTPLTLPDGSVLFSLNFLAAGAAGTSSLVSFGGSPTPIAAYNVGLQAVPVPTLSGVVHIAAQAGFAVSGNVARASGTPVPQVLVELTGDATGNDRTDAPGDYGFANLAAGSELTLTPSKTAAPLECVSVRDILFISKHILGVAPLSNPYRMIAADANQSGSVTTFDTQELRKLILGIYAQLPGAPSWRFVQSDYIFPNPNNPFQTTFPETAEIATLQSDVVRDFVAVKTGDATDCVGDTPGAAFLTTLASNTSGTPGQQVTVNVTALGFSDVSGLQLSMQWDPSVAQFDGVANYTLPGMVAESFHTAQAGSGKLSLCWWTDNPGIGQTLPNGSTIFSLQFTLLGPIGSSTPVAFVQTPTRFEVVDGNCDPFGLNVVGGLISVVAQLPPNQVQLIASNATSFGGAPICVPVRADNFTDVASAQFTSGWDPAKFSFLQLQNLNPQLGLNSSNFNTAQSGSGLLTFSWLDQNAGGVTLPANTTLFEVCFEPVGAIGTSGTLSFPGAPVPVEIINSNLDPLPVQTTNGTLTIAPASANDPIILTISPTPQTVASGDVVTVHVSVANCTNLAGYQFSMSWDPAVLQLQSVTPAVPGMSVGGNFNIGNSANGRLTHLFFSQGLTPLTLPDGSVLFSLNFLAAGAAGTSSLLHFGGTPTPIAAYNVGLQAVPVTTLSGIVYIAAQAGFAVSGNIRRESGVPVPEVLVALTGDATGSDLTDAPGDYGFANLAAGSDLTLTPSKTADPLECVSVRDILFIYKHILGLAPLPNPYAMVAADANRSKSITTFDTQELRKLILGIYAELPNAPSWQFILEDFVFQNSNNPFLSSYPEVANIVDLQADAVRDFVAVKTGDVTDCTGDVHGPAFMTTLASSANGQQGQQVAIDVTVQGFSNVSGLQFSIQWDPAVAQFNQNNGVTNLTLPGLGSASFNTSEAGSGKLSLCWWANYQDGPQTLPNGTVLFSLPFTLVGPAGSSTPVAFVQTPTRFEVVDGDCDPFELNISNGQITISGQQPPPTPSLQFISGNATSVNGSVVCAPVCTSNFTDITSAQFSLGWDPAVFGFQQVKNFNPALIQLNASNFFTGQSSNGLLGFAWSDPAGLGVTLPNGAVLFEVCFTPVGPDGASTPLAFPNAPIPQEFYDENGLPLSAQTTSGTLNIVASGANPITVLVSPNAQTVPSGTPVTVDIVVEDFTDMAGYQFSMSWDPAVLQLQSVTPVLPYMSVGGNFNIGNSGNGALTHLFFVQDLTPLTLPDGSALFKLNFVAVGAAGTSSLISFGGSPTPIAAYNVGLQAVPVTTLPGIVYIAGSPPPLPTQLLASSATSIGGAPVCSQISMNGFTEIIAAQFTVAWDPSKFSFQQLKSFNPALGLSGGNFSTAQAGNGLLLFSWSDPQALGVTLPDMPVLFEVCFTPVGPVGAVSSVSFPNLPQHPIEIVKEPGGPLPVQTINGMLTIAAASLPCGINCPSGIPALTANSSCQAFLGDYTSLATLSGDCIGPIVQTPAPGTVVNPGTVAVTLTVSNVAGQSTMCRFNVVVSGGCGH